MPAHQRAVNIQMEKSKGGGGRMWSGLRRQAPSTAPPSVAASVTKETIVPIMAPELPGSGASKSSHSKKDSKPVNRFGFRPVVHNKPDDVKAETTKTYSPNNNNTSLHGATSKFGFKRHTKTSNADPMHIEIENLKESPSATKYRSREVKRPSQISFGGRRNKTFNMTDLERETRRVEESNNAQAMASSITSESNNEEKHQRDMISHEKRTESLETSAEGDDLLRGYGEAPVDEVWGHGEAMALPEEIASLDQLESSTTLMNPPLRSVLLEIEDPMFTSLATLSSRSIHSNNSGLLEDEKSPDLAPASPDLSSGSPPSVEPLPPPPPNIKDGAESGVSPAHETMCSSSYSSDAGRDFLIDDEIADQPALVFDTSHPPVSAQISNLAGQVSRVLESLHESPKLKERKNSTSLGTLSPCDSLASDDLMVDFDLTNSNIDDLNEIDDSVLHSELEMQSSQVMKEWNSILSAHPRLKPMI